MAVSEKTDVPLRVHQAFDWKPTKGRRLYGSAWIRTDRPDRLSLWLAPLKPDGTPGDPPEASWSRHAARAGHWHKVVVGGELPEGVTRFAVGFSLAGPDARADVDAVELFHWSRQHNLAPTGVDTPAQQLFLVDAFRVMIEQGIRRSHLHHLFGSYPCGIMLTDGRTKDNYKVFEFLADRLGTHTVKTTVSGESFDHNCLADKFATDFNAIAPDVKGVPVISTLAMRDDRHLYVLVINRTTDVPVEATIRVHDARLTGAGTLRSLTCEDFDIPGIRVKERDLPAGRPPIHRLAPHSAYLVTRKLATGTD